MNTLWVALGGALGSMARYHVDLLARARFGVAFPWGTLVVNLVGSFFISAILVAGLRGEWLSPTARLALITGLLGGFTTYSSFNHEVLRQLHEGAAAAALAYVAATVLGCLAAGSLGWIAGRALLAS